MRPNPVVSQRNSVALNAGAALVLLLGGIGGSATAQIAGTAVDRAGQSVRDVAVDLRGPGVFRRVRLDNQGRFRFPNFPRRVRVWVQAFGYGLVSKRHPVVALDTTIRLTLLPTEGNRPHAAPRGASRGVVVVENIATLRPRAGGEPPHGSGCDDVRCNLVVDPNVGRVYYWTHVTTARRGATIQHVWYREEREMARITLPVTGSRWWTSSSMRIRPQWLGYWRVDVRTAARGLLDSRSFTVEATSDSIGPDELARIAPVTSTAWEAIVTLRSRWLTGHPVPRSCVASDSVDRPRMYVDGVYAGPYSALDTVPFPRVRLIRSFDAQAAAARWGADETTGCYSALEVTTKTYGRCPTSAAPW